MPASKAQRHALLSSENSRRNKMALLAGYLSNSIYVKHQWAGVQYNSRMKFQFAVDGEWLQAKSYDEDIKPLLKDK
jgi:hypothetical protein